MMLRNRDGISKCFLVLAFLLGAPLIIPQFYGKHWTSKGCQETGLTPRGNWRRASQAKTHTAVPSRAVATSANKKLFWKHASGLRQNWFRFPPASRS
jgi:hypothetical protein